MSSTISALPLFTGPITAATTLFTLVDPSNVNKKITFQTILDNLPSSGDVVGPGSATDNALARFDTTTGKLIQNSLAILNDAGALSGLTQLDVDNLELNGNTLSTTNVNGDLLFAPNGTGVTSSVKSFKTSASFIMKDSGSNTVARQAPTTLVSSYRIFEATTIPTVGQVALVSNVSGTDVSMGWGTNSSVVVTPTASTWSGVWASPQTANLESRVQGNTVTLVIEALPASTGTIADIATASATLPFVPAQMQLKVITVYDNGLAINGLLVVGSDGSLEISTEKAGLAGIQGGNDFVGAGVTGWPEICVTYSLT